MTASYRGAGTQGELPFDELEALAEADQKLVQDENLERLTSRLSNLILAFCRGRLAEEATFHMVELTSWIARHHCVAPDSPGRILRALRSRGLVSYDVLNRSQSLYRIVEVGE